MSLAVARSRANNEKTCIEMSSATVMVTSDRNACL